MATTAIDDPSPRVAAVLAHVAVENAHDLDAVMATFGQGGRYDDEPWGEHHDAAGRAITRR